MYDYAAITARFLEILGVREPDVIAHSFGGRVAIILAAHSLTGRVLITDGAGSDRNAVLSIILKSRRIS
ncbi:MAG: alpha/beta fold hydrolase [Christensenellales bacterium]